MKVTLAAILTGTAAFTGTAYGKRHNRHHAPDAEAVGMSPTQPYAADYKPPKASIAGPFTAAGQATSTSTVIVSEVTTTATATVNDVPRMEETQPFDPAYVHPTLNLKKRSENMVATQPFDPKYTFPKYPIIEDPSMEQTVPFDPAYTLDPTPNLKKRWIESGRPTIIHLTTSTSTAMATVTASVPTTLATSASIVDNWYVGDDEESEAEKKEAEEDMKKAYGEDAMKE